MRSPVRFVALALFFLEPAQAGHLEPAADGASAPKPEHPAFIQVEDIPGLPRVLSIGDSISIGYTLPVRELLQDVANVHRAPENCGPTKQGLKRLDKWLGDSRWDVIHFNFGLHDMKYLDAKGRYVSPDKGTQVAPIALYASQLREIVKRLQGTGAKLIFATTTPVPKGAKGRVSGDEILYNQAAIEVMKSANIPISDLHEEICKTIKESPEGEIQETANVHFTAKGYSDLAVTTAQAIQHALRTNSQPVLR